MRQHTQTTNRNRTHRIARGRLGFGSALAVLSLVAIFTGGCAAIAGIEKRQEPEDGFTKLDVATEIRTSELCIEYCDTLENNCKDALYPYLTRASCINTCNALPEGVEAEPLGNTVYCRLAEADRAKSQADEHCGAAGPGGQDTCGSNCDAWCSLLESECPDDFSNLGDCAQACKGLADNGTLDVAADYSTNTLQCRLIHLGAVGEEGQESVHCGHARYVPEDTCVDESGVPSCDEYCSIVMANCQEENAVYDSKSDCTAACAAFELGELGETDTNTVGCRTYHSQAAAGGAVVHCSHSSPAGDGQCGENCESYCQLLQAGCDAVFAASFGSVEECTTSCEADFSSNGAAAGSKYAVLTAHDEDSLQCRISYAVKAVSGEAAACIKAAPGSNCD